MPQTAESSNKPRKTGQPQRNKMSLPTKTKTYKVKDSEPVENNEECLELLKLSMGVACIQIYAKDHKLEFLDGLTSKVGEEVKTEKSRIEDMKHSLQQKERENKSLQNKLMQIANVQEFDQKETKFLKKQIEAFRLNTCRGNEIHLIDVEFEKIRHEFSTKLERIDRENAVQFRLLEQSFQDKLESKMSTIMHLSTEIKKRDIKLKSLEDNCKSYSSLEEEDVSELKYQLRETVKKLTKTEHILSEAIDGLKLEQRVRKDFERKAGKYHKHNEHLQEIINKLSMSEIAFQDTSIQLQKTKTENEIETRNKQKLQRQVSEHKKRIQVLEKANTTLKTSQKQLKEHFQSEVEQRDQKLERKDELGEIEQKKLKKAIKETKEKLFELTNQHEETLANLKEREDILARTNSEKEIEKRKRQELEKHMCVYENRIKLSKDETLEVLQTKEQRINQLEMEVESKGREIKYLEASLSEMKQDVRDKTNMREELKYNQDQLSDLRNRMKQVLTKWEKTEDELVKTKFEMSKRNEIEITVSEYQDRIKQIERGTMENMTSQNQIVQNLKKDLETSTKSLNLEVSEKHQLKKDLKETDDRLLELECQHQHTLETLETIKAELESDRRIRKEWERKANENENRIGQTKNENDEILKSQRQRIIQFESVVQDKDREIKALGDSLHTMKHDNSDIITLRKEFKQIIRDLEDEVKCKDNQLKASQHILDETKNADSDRDRLREESHKTIHQLSELGYKHNQTVAKLSEIESQLDEARHECQSEQQSRQELERKISKLENELEDTKMINKQTTTFQKENIDDLVKEAEDKDRKINNLEASNKTLNREVSEGSQLKKDLKETKYKLSQLEYQHQQTLEQLGSMEAKLVQTLSDKESEWHNRKELERQARENENRIEQTKSENDEMLQSQKQRINELKFEVEEKDREVIALHASVNNMKHDISDITGLMKQLKEYEDQLASIKKKMQHTLTQLTKTENDLEETNAKHNLELRSQQHQTAIKLKEQEDKLDEAKREIYHEQQRRQDLERKSFESENRLKEANKQEIASQKEKIHYLENVVAHNDNKMKELAASIERNKLEINERQRLKTELTETKDKLSEAEIQQQQTIAKLRRREAELDEIKTKKGFKENDNILKEMKDQLHQVLSKLKETETELDETKTRLSKAMGDRLTDNNPNIADLSDTNRPIKLAERFAELYDNQWTDAFDILEKMYDREQHTIEALLQVLQDTMQFCEANAKKQLDDVQNILGFSRAMETGKVPTDVRKHLKDCRKKMSSTAIRNLFEMYIAHVKTSAPQKVKTAQDVRPFVKQCLELCWLMTIQDPPVVLAPVAKSGSNLNTDVFKPYTSSGTHIDYTVWPALLLHDGGPVLAKGVAQGYGKKSKTKH